MAIQEKKNDFLKIDAKKETYLIKLFSLLRNRENMIVVEKGAHFNNTELRMIREVLLAKCENKRLISTQIAKLLGVTRSAISQIVNRLEGRGVLKRVPDETDKKIAYIELTDDIIDMYKEDLQSVLQFVGNVIAEFGEEKFNTLCSLFDEFNTLTQNKLKRAKKK